MCLTKQAKEEKKEICVHEPSPNWRKDALLGQSLNEILMPVSRQNAVKIISQISLELLSPCNTKIE